MPNGTVRFFHQRKSFGFISRPGPYDDVFFHISDIEGGPPERGVKVKFELRHAARGPRAVEIKRVGDGE